MPMAYATECVEPFCDYRSLFHKWVVVIIHQLLIRHVCVPVFKDCSEHGISQFSHGTQSWRNSPDLLPSWVSDGQGLKYIDLFVIRWHDFTLTGGSALTWVVRRLQLLLGTRSLPCSTPWASSPTKIKELSCIETSSHWLGRNRDLTNNDCDFWV